MLRGWVIKTMNGAMAHPRWARWLNFLRLSATVVFIALAVRAVQWQKMADALRHTSLFVAIGAAVVYAVLQCLSATRWWSIAKASKMPLSWKDAVAAFYVGMFFNLFLPGLVGGDAVRALLAAQVTSHSAASSFGIVYADRTVGFIAMLLVGLWGAIALHLTQRQLIWQPLLFGAVFAIGVTAIIVALFSAIGRWGKGVWAQRIGRFANGIVAFPCAPPNGCLRVRHRPRLSPIVDGELDDAGQSVRHSRSTFRRLRDGRRHRNGHRVASHFSARVRRSRVGKREVVGDAGRASGSGDVVGTFVAGDGLARFASRWARLSSVGGQNSLAIFGKLAGRNGEPL